MTITPLFNLRRVIPRWRDAKTTLTTGELLVPQTSSHREISGLDLFQEKLKIWRAQGGIEFAAEVVTAAISQELYDDAIDAAEFLISKNDTKSTVISIAKQVLFRSGKKVVEKTNNLQNTIANHENLYKRIHDLRNLLNDYPRNALMWADLSLNYVLLGQLQQSREVMTRAIILAPNNRFILRSATRLFVHLDEPDTAHDLLINKVITRFDPWLIAAEIATASVANIKPKLVREGKEFLERGKLPPFHLAELASALATLELNAGSLRKARKLFQLSLIEPTENSVAQSVWVKKDLPTLETDIAVNKTPRVFEARALDALFKMKWSEAVEASQLWLTDEAFSSRPAELGSYAASLGLENYFKAECFARDGLVANPNDLTLINNLAYALANQNKLIEALKTINNVSQSFTTSTEGIAIAATKGLINIRMGQIEKGKELYLQAISSAWHTKNIDHYAFASINYAREMLRADNMTKNEALAIAENASSFTSNPHVHFLLGQYFNNSAETKNSP